MFQSSDIVSAVRASALRYPDKACIVAPDQVLTFRQFYDSVELVADYMASLGVRAGDRVAILDIDTKEYVIVLFALAVLDATAVPLNYRQRFPEILFQVENSGARLLLANRRYENEVQPLKERLDLGCHNIERFVSDAGGHGRSAHERLRASKNPFLICYTSGTTGRPKGAVLDQHAMWLRAIKYIIEFGIHAEDVVYVAFPMFHIGGLVYSLMSVIRGATLVLVPQFEITESLASARRNKVTFMAVVPTMLAKMVEARDFGKDYFGDIRLIMYGGSPMNLTHLRKIMTVYRGDLVQSFGQTEDLPQVVLTAADHRAALFDGSKRLGSVGRPPFGVELRICDSEGRPVPQGEIGEIVTRGGTGMTGYWGREEETAMALKDGWVFSGDLGYEDDDGFLYLAGRKRQMIIRGGENIYPAEVERVILQLPGVADCVVLGLPDSHWGEIVGAVVVADEELLPRNEIVSHCRKFLASYRCPEKIIFTDTLPYNATGKVDRNLLLAELAAK